MDDYEKAQADRCGGIDYQPTKSEIAIDAIEARMEPITAAHRVAQCLDTIARLLPLLSAEARDGYLDGMSVFDDELMTAYCAMLRRKAEKTRLAAPIEPVTDEERQEVWENTIGQVQDFSTRDHAEVMVGDYTEADWRYEADMLKAYELDDEE